MSGHDDYEPEHSASPTDHIVQELQLYGYRPSEGEADRLFAARDAVGVDLGTVGLRRGTVSGSFMHLIDLAGEAA